MGVVSHIADLQINCILVCFLYFLSSLFHFTYLLFYFLLFSSNNKNKNKKTKTKKQKQKNKNKKQKTKNKKNKKTKKQKTKNKKQKTKKTGRYCLIAATGCILLGAGAWTVNAMDSLPSLVFLPFAAVLSYHVMFCESSVSLIGDEFYLPFSVTSFSGFFFCFFFDFVFFPFSFFFFLFSFFPFPFSLSPHYFKKE